MPKVGDIIYGISEAGLADFVEADCVATCQHVGAQCAIIASDIFIHPP